MNSAIQLLIVLVSQDPIQLGYDFHGWTPQRLADHLARHQQIILSTRQIEIILMRYRHDHSKA